MHRGGHDVELLGLPAPQPTPGAGLLVESQEAPYVAQIGPNPTLMSPGAIRDN